ncbi:hypothetical protein V8G54_031955 [Vigna mungo]|uniref:Uncharacterized protein n=1 Tax=Vigna mungo TaxID=3915 RepID=A0AAQ3MKK9_VIGMU
MEGVVATGNQSSGLVGGNVVEADGAFGAHEKVFSGDGGELLELRRGEAGVGDRLGRSPEAPEGRSSACQLVEVWVKKKVLKGFLVTAGFIWEGCYAFTFII